jgi:hypothetical protein
MRLNCVILAVIISFFSLNAAHADELEDEIKRNLTPEHFDPGSVDRHTLVYLIRNNRRLFIDSAELLRLNEAGLQRGIKYQVLEFKMLDRSVGDSIAMVSYRTSISEQFQDERVVTDTVSREMWERHVHGWVLLFGAVQEISSSRQ